MAKKQIKKIKRKKTKKKDELFRFKFVVIGLQNILDFELKCFDSTDIMTYILILVTFLTAAPILLKKVLKTSEDGDDLFKLFIRLLSTYLVCFLSLGKSL